ncbi:hypothetical protein ACFHW2_11760 [Actinomadura sp. LOL_016]|uniref:DUF7620 family protein n=1 Tax=unclassified Actinomadura TaxID=2626254 RepID=UPI003A7FEB9C
MRLPWRREAEHEQVQPADEAIAISEQRRDRAMQASREFRRLATRMRTMREVNHLAAAFKATFWEGRQ